MARPCKARGMTLVEVLVASVILGMGVAGLMSAATLSMRNQLRGEHRATALCLAQQKLAEVDLIGAHVWMLAQPMKGVEESEGIAYAWSLDIEQQQVGALFTVGVQVDWSGGSSGTVELETLLNDYEAKGALGSGQQTPTRGNTGTTPPSR